jgi:hypothetical protein
VGLSLRSIAGVIDGPGFNLPDPSLGIDGDGTGVWGASGGGRGGVFTSQTNSQLRLVPAPRSPGQQRITERTNTNSPFPELPPDGQAGDLIATLEPEPDGNRGDSLQARLWFCVRSVDVDPNTNRRIRAAGWAQVLLGDTFDGG